MRGRDPDLRDAFRLNQATVANGNAHLQIAAIRRLMGRPAVIAAVAVGPADGVHASPDSVAPVIMSVKFIDEGALARIATQLRLTNLRRIEQDPIPTGDLAFDVNGPDGNAIVRFAWTPKQPGAEIVHNVVPFIAVALAGFALLAAFVLRYMRRTAATIAAGETRLRHLAMHDPLCGLPNRIFFGERLEAVIAEVRGGGAPAAVFYIDLDHFKDVNDTLGHPVGDELIRNVTLRLSHTLRGDDLVARLGGDEFAVITSSLATATRCWGSRNALSQHYARPIHQRPDHRHRRHHRHRRDRPAVRTAADIMRYADMALYRAKNEGRNRACIYDAAMDADLSSASCSKQTCARRSRMTACSSSTSRSSTPAARRSSASRRWPLDAPDPRRDPADRIHPDRRALRTDHRARQLGAAARLPRRQGLAGHDGRRQRLAAAIPPHRFRRGRSSASWRETDFDPTRLELELTESTLLGNVDTAEAAMLRLKALGVRLALDDFGTGYSSLLYLRRFPFDKLKIDRSFVLSIEKAADAAAIVHAIVSLGRGLGMKVTAEGVETAEQQLFLRAAGVHSMQGFRFGRPVTVAEITARLQSPNAFELIEVPLAS